MKESLTLPHFPEMERALLAAFLVDPESLEEVLALLEDIGKGVFHLEVHRRV